jgi:uncharacterized phiE125 gp8 family phage protein
MTFLSTQIVTPPIVEPITLAFAKQQLRVDFEDDDAIISALITAARQHCEKKTRRAFFNQTWVRTLDFFPLYGHAQATRTPTERDNWPYGTWYWDKVTIDLPYPRTISVSSITYLDDDADEQTLSTTGYNVDYTSLPARISPAQGLFWPILNNYIPGNIRITFVAGSYVRAVTGETFTLPAMAPYTYTPAQSPVTAITSVLDGESQTPEYTFEDGVLTFEAASAGLSYTLDYYVGDCPQTIIQAMILLIKFWYQHSITAPTPGAVPTPIDKAVDALLGNYIVNVIEYR